MSSVNSGGPPALQNLLIVRLGAMGDIIHTLPAVGALREALPATHFGWVVEERWVELLCTLTASRTGPRSAQRPLVDRIHVVNTFKWRKALLSIQTWREFVSVIRDLRAPHYDAAIDFQGAIRSALLARWSGAGKIYGFAAPREKAARMLYTRRVTARGPHIIEQNMSLAETVAASDLRLTQPIFPVDEDSELACARNLQEQAIADFVLINPGAGWGAKRWPELRYAEVARELTKDGFKVLINFGPGEESLARSVEQSSAGAAQGISCSVTQLVALTRRARLFIGGDTGPLHLAAALGIPVVAIFGPTNPARNGPFTKKSVVLRSPDSITSHARHAQPEQGLLQITSAEVVQAARRMLRGDVD